MNLNERLRYLTEEPGKTDRMIFSIKHGLGGVQDVYKEVGMDFIRTTKVLEGDLSVPHNPLILITGVSASGKDHMCHEVSQLTGIKAIGSGTTIAKVAGISQDEVRFMKFEDYRAAKLIAADEIIDQAPAIVNVHLVTTHYLTNNSMYKNPKEVGSAGHVFLEEFEKKLNPEHIVAVISDPEAILKWRKARNTTGERSSDIEPLEIIALHQRETIVKSYEFAKEYGVGFSIVYNQVDPHATQRNTEFLADICMILKK